MEADIVQSTNEIRLLKACINNLLSIQTLPAIWDGGRPSQIVGTLLDVLQALLDLDFAYAQLKDSTGEGPFETVRIAHDRSLMIQPQDIGRVLSPWLGDVPRTLPLLVPNPIGDGAVSIASLGLGQRDEMGVLVAGSVRVDFPTPGEKLLLSVAANQVVMALHEVRRLREKEELAHELDQRVAERTSELVAVNEELRREIANRRQAEEDLRRSEAYLAGAQRLSHTGSFGWSVLSGEIYWSEETYNIFEHDRAAQPTLELALQRVHPDDRDLLQQTLDRATNERANFDLEHRLLMPDGRVKHIHVLARALQTSSGYLEFVGAVTDVTAAKQAEETLRESEAYLAEAQTLSHTGSWAWTPATGEIRYWSEECYRVLGFDPHGGQPRFETFFQRIHQDDQAKTREKLERARGDKAEFDLDYRIVHPGGEIRDIHVVGHPVLSLSGDLVEFVGTVIDITERKRAEKELRTSEAYLAEAQRLSHTGSWAWRVPERDAVHLSEEFYRIYGFDPEDGLPAWEKRLQRVHPEDRAKWQGVIERAISEKSDYELEFRILHPGGSVKYIHGVGHPVFNASGDLVQFVGSSTDVTAARQAEGKIRQSERELQQLLDLTPFHITEFGPDGTPLYNNKAALDYHGLTLEEWKSADLDTLLHPQDAERLRREHPGKFLSGSPYEIEARLRRKDGQHRWFLFRFNPILDEHGCLTRWYAAATDIEARKQAEQRLQNENVALREEIDKASMFEEIVGTSPPLQTVLSRISKVAPTDSSVLITGETGTGKELVARAIHRRSRRASRAFVSVNCAVIPRDLIASELFGHEKGAFTGATQRRLGRFELAEGGTIFLDEIGELPAETQITLLRVLQEHEFERVGGTGSIRTNVRVIAATNRDLEAAIATGLFRSDLFYRFNVFPIEMPPLRERREDIPLLVGYFIDRYARKAGKNFQAVNRKSLDLLQSYPWPGNIRELQNVIERSVIVCETENFSVDESWLSQRPLATDPNSEPGLFKRLPSQEKAIIEAALRETGGRVSGPSGAAAKLGIHRSTLDSKIRSLKINAHRFKTPAPPKNS
jgi:PAS domain S-box-containing protein